jgi:hypothetical protein
MAVLGVGADTPITGRTRSRCQRSRVSGWMKKPPRRWRGNSWAGLARSARSAGWSAGRSIWRRSTATSWRSMTTSIARSASLWQENQTS